MLVCCVVFVCVRHAGFGVRVFVRVRRFIAGVGVFV
jgi:hypothetical protein